MHSTPDFARPQVRLPVLTNVRLTKAVARVASYLHTNGFIHRDIKAANLLIDDDGTVLLGDLGVAADLAEDPSHHSSSHLHRSHHRTTAQAAVSEPGIQHHFTSSDVPDKRTMVNDSSTRPKMGKRKSFVGTVSPFLVPLLRRH
jgi:serine/threonine-protein kinase OSR1/STK39